MLTREQILSAKDKQITRIPVPEWGGEVCVCPMTGAERDSLDRLNTQEGVRIERAAIAALMICDEDGNRLFSEQDLADKNGAVLERIISQFAKVNGLGDQGVEEARGN